MSHRKDIFDLTHHLTPLALSALKDGTLSREELILVTTHISNCLACADAFADIFEDGELIDPPVGFIKSLEYRLSINDKGKKDLLFYSLRVGLAVCASLAMVFFGSLGYNSNFGAYTKAIKPPDLQFVHSINMGLKNFSQKLLNMEVFLNETKKR